MSDDEFTDPYGFTGLRAAANWFLVTCPDGSTQGVQDTIPCGLNN